MKKPIKTLIVDDEPLAREALRVLLDEDADIEIVGEARDGRNAAAMIERCNPDLIFLDVQMPDADGFEVLRRLDSERMPVVVFVTAYDQYALRAFESHALDYLLKPFDHERFDVALDRGKRQVRLRRLGDVSKNLAALLDDFDGLPKEADKKPEQSPPTKFPERLAVKSNERIFFLKIADIDWIEATGDYMRLHVANRSHLLRETMSNLILKLDSEKFLRIHRSTIVNIERVRDVQPLFKGEYAVTLQDGTQLKLSRGCRSKLQKFFGQLL